MKANSKLRAQLGDDYEIVINKYGFDDMLGYNFLIRSKKTDYSASNIQSWANDELIKWQADRLNAAPMLKSMAKMGWFTVYDQHEYDKVLEMIIDSIHKTELK